MKHTYEELSIFIEQIGLLFTESLSEEGQQMLQEIKNIVTIAYEEGEVD